MKKFLYYLGSEGLSRIVSYLAVLLAAKIFDVSTFGELTIYFIINEFLIIIITNNISATTRIDFFKLDRALYKINKLHHFVVSFMLLLITLGIAGILSYKINFLFVSLLAIGAFLKTFSFYVLADLQCKADSKNYAKISLAYVLLMNAIYLIFLAMKLEIEAWIFSVFAANVIQFIVATRYLSSDNFFTGVNFSAINLATLKKEYNNGAIFLPQAFGFWARIGSERMILSIVTNLTILGIYMFNFQLAWPIVIFANVINLYLTPKVNVFIKANDWFSLKKLLKKYLFLILLASVVCASFAFFVSWKFYYDKYFDSISIMPFIVVANFFYAGMLLYMNVLYFLGEKKYISMFVFVTSSIYIPISYLLTSQFQIVGLVGINLLFNISVFVLIYIKFSNTVLLYKHQNG